MAGRAVTYIYQAICIVFYFFFFAPSLDVAIPRAAITIMGMASAVVHHQFCRRFGVVMVFYQT